MGAEESISTPDTLHRSFTKKTAASQRPFMPLSLEQYAAFLDARHLPWPDPPAVKRPKAKPHVVPIEGLKAVTWNIYGTLLAITGGEVFFEHPDRYIMEVALEKTVLE